MIMDMIGVSKWSRHKDRYIGRLYLDTGKVPGEIGTIPELREVIRTPGEVYGPYWALVERRGKDQGRGRPPKPNPNWEGGLPPFPSSLLPLPSLSYS